jgi:hypothetical protein
MKYEHGDYVTCKIHDKEIKDARISIDIDGHPFICQNQIGGIDAEDKLGYKWSWSLREDFSGFYVSDLKPLK